MWGEREERNPLPILRWTSLWTLSTPSISHFKGCSCAFARGCYLFVGFVDKIQQAQKEVAKCSGAGGGDDVDKNFHCVFLSALVRA